MITQPLTLLFLPNIRNDSIKILLTVRFVLEKNKILDILSISSASDESPEKVNNRMVMTMRHKKILSFPEMGKKPSDPPLHIIT